MPRFIIYRFKELPTSTMPCGMNDIVSMGDYASAANAKRYGLKGQDGRLRSATPFGYAYLGIYESPRGYNPKDKERLVETVNLAQYLSL